MCIVCGVNACMAFAIGTGMLGPARPIFGYYLTSVAWGFLSGFSTLSCIKFGEDAIKGALARRASNESAEES